jgi:GT2 family glycosyltransferase
MKSPLSIAIPTFGRHEVMIDTVRHLLAIELPAAEILLLDQTSRHEAAVETQLRDWEAKGQIRWLRLLEPSIPHAMNHGLLAASQEIVLFLDDDIRPEPGLLQAHLAAHRVRGAALVAGRVIQPWQEGSDFSQDVDFHFASLSPLWVDNFMGGNFSIRRVLALSLGGFDENFVKVAYRFEAEFAYRLRGAGYRIFYEPNACIHHLKATAGGTRTFGNHLTTIKPDHAVGDYYYILRTWTGWASLRAFVGRPLRAIINRHHLRRPWWIPATLLAEIAGMIWAFRLYRLGPSIITHSL